MSGNPFRTNDSKTNDWGKVKFKPQHGQSFGLKQQANRVEEATPWIRFRQEFIQKQNDEKNAKIDAEKNSSEANKFKKQREKNYRKLMITEKRKELTKWETDFDEVDKKNSKSFKRQTTDEDGGKSRKKFRQDFTENQSEEQSSQVDTKTDETKTNKFRKKSKNSFKEILIENPEDTTMGKTDFSETDKKQKTKSFVLETLENKKKAKSKTKNCQDIERNQKQSTESDGKKSKAEVDFGETDEKQNPKSFELEAQKNKKGSKSKVNSGQDIKRNEEQSTESDGKKSGAEIKKMEQERKIIFKKMLNKEREATKLKTDRDETKLSKETSIHGENRIFKKVISDELLKNFDSKKMTLTQNSFFRSKMTAAHNFRSGDLKSAVRDLKQKGLPKRFLNI